MPNPTSGRGSSGSGCWAACMSRRAWGWREPVPAPGGRALRDGACVDEGSAPRDTGGSALGVLAPGLPALLRRGRAVRGARVAALSAATGADVGIGFATARARLVAAARFLVHGCPG